MSEVDDFLAHLALLNAQGGQEAVIAFGVETGIVSPD